MSEDIRDILALEKAPGPQVSKEEILGMTKKRVSRPSANRQNRRPEGMAREVFALLCDEKNDVAPVIETESGPTYKLQKAKLGMRRARPWVWAPFVNPAREDGVKFYHWKRVADEEKPYPFAAFNKKIEIPKYTDTEYEENLVSDTWSRKETDRLFEACERFDLRFIVIQGRWNYGEYANDVKRSTEELKDRYYSVCNTLIKIRGGKVNEAKMYDAEHETRRKLQLETLYSRTQEQIDKRTPHHRRRIAVPARPIRIDPDNLKATTIKFPDVRNSGVSTRSQKMKIPANASQKKVKNVELALESLKIKLNPIPTEEVCQNYNDLRNEIVLLNELKAACSSSDFELESLKQQYKTLNPNGGLKISSKLMEELDSLSVEEEENVDEIVYID